MVDKQLFSETELLNKAGGKIPVEINARLYDQGGEGTVLWEAHDIADRKQVEEALRQAHDDLERRVEERTAELAEINVTLNREIQERKRAEQVLEESAQQLRILTSRLLDAEERERRRISIELHDELGQALTLLKFRISSLKKSCANTNQAFENDFGSLLQYLDATIENVRRISLDLCPTIVEEFGLNFALEYLFEEFREHYDLRWCSIEMDEIDKFLSQPVQVNIYRIFQEILTNALKHANASRLTAVIRKHEEHVAFQVQDNGKGFDVPGTLAGEAKIRGTGIAAMYERVRLMGGSLEMLSQPGSGTTIAFKIPINRDLANDRRL
jgi:signal transduction histidine kinase